MAGHICLNISAGDQTRIRYKLFDIVFILEDTFLPGCRDEINPQIKFSILIMNPDCECKRFFVVIQGFSKLCHGLFN